MWFDTSGFWLHSDMQMCDGFVQVERVWLSRSLLIFDLAVYFVWFDLVYFGNGIRVEGDLPDAHRSTYIDVLILLPLLLLLLLLFLLVLRPLLLLTAVQLPTVCLSLLASWRNEMSYGRLLCMQDVVVVQISQPTQMQREMTAWPRRCHGWVGHAREHEPRTIRLALGEYAQWFGVPFVYNDNDDSDLKTVETMRRLWLIK